MGSGVAVLGAGGFVGARLLEMAVRTGRDDIVPIVRALRSVGRAAHLGTTYRLGDVSRRDSLERALAGCAAVVNLTKGDPSEIVPATKTIYDAAVAAGARLLVHLSSATVYGDVERPDIPDDAPPLLGHWMRYAREKGLAENFLRERMADRRLEIVVLRPGLIWGPRSPWVLAPAGELLRGTSYVVGDGTGICNLMYVDNLVRSIDAVVAHPAVSSGFYHVGDDETTTWREFYLALALGLGVDPATIHTVSAATYRATLRDRLASVQGLAAYKWLRDRLNLETRATIKLRLAEKFESDPLTMPSAAGSPVVTREMWHLQNTRYKLPIEKFRTTFGPQNATSFRSGIASSVAWLGFIGIDGHEDARTRARSQMAS